TSAGSAIAPRLAMPKSSPSAFPAFPAPSPAPAAIPHHPPAPLPGLLLPPMPDKPPTAWPPDPRTTRLLLQPIPARSQFDSPLQPPPLPSTPPPSARTATGENQPG